MNTQTSRSCSIGRVLVSQDRYSLLRPRIDYPSCCHTWTSCDEGLRWRRYIHWGREVHCGPTKGLVESRLQPKAPCRLQSHSVSSKRVPLPLSLVLAVGAGGLRSHFHSCGGATCEFDGRTRRQGDDVNRHIRGRTSIAEKTGSNRTSATVVTEVVC